MNQKKNLIRKRFYRKVRSFLKARIRRKAKIKHAKVVKYNLHDVKPFIKCLFYNETKIVKKEISIEVPEIYCLASDHNAALKFIAYFEHVLSKNKAFNLYISHKNTKKLGLVASYIFDKRVRDYLKYWKNRGYEIVIRGDISDVKDVNNFLLSFGFLADLQILSDFDEDHVDSDYKNKFVTFKFEGSSGKGYLKGNASTELANYFKKCFNYCNLDITVEGHGMLADAFGEIIGNAEEHNKENQTTWHALGCYNKDNNYCSFAIINTGTTIYQSLSSLESTSSDVLTEVYKFAKNNDSLFKKVSNIGKTGIEESLWNVFALQDGISSKRRVEGTASTRGLGLMDVLEFIGTLKSSDDNGQVCIISGKSKIVVDYDYPIKTIEVGPNKDKRRQIVFNESGSLYDEQDKSKVFYMDGNILGTVITGNFKINESYLVDKLENMSNESKI